MPISTSKGSLPLEQTLPRNCEDHAHTPPHAHPIQELGAKCQVLSTKQIPHSKHMYTKTVDTLWPPANTSLTASRTAISAARCRSWSVRAIVGYTIDVVKHLENHPDDGKHQPDPKAHSKGIHQDCTSPWLPPLLPARAGGSRHQASLGTRQRLTHCRGLACTSIAAPAASSKQRARYVHTRRG